MYGKGQQDRWLPHQVFWILLYIVGIGIILPVLISLVAGFPAGIIMSFILSTFALQAAAP